MDAEFVRLRRYAGLLLLLAIIAACYKAEMPAGSATAAPTRAIRFAISQNHEGVTRTITVHVTADPGRQIARVPTDYDNFSLADEKLKRPSSSYDGSFKKTEGVTPNQRHTVVVRAWDTDGFEETGQKTWTD